MCVRRGHSGLRHVASLWASKHIFDLMALFIGDFTVSSREVMVLSRRDAGRYSLDDQCGPKLVTVISLVTKQSSGDLQAMPDKSVWPRYDRSSGPRSGTG